MCAESWIEAPQINDCAHVRNHGSRIPVSMIPHNPFCAETLTSLGRFNLTLARRLSSDQLCTFAHIGANGR